MLKEVGTVCVCMVTTLPSAFVPEDSGSTVECIEGTSDLCGAAQNSLEDRSQHVDYVKRNIEVCM